MVEHVLITDHSSTEGSRAVLADAVELLTGRPPTLLDARYFMTGGPGRVRITEDALQFQVPSETLSVTPSSVIIYEIPPGERSNFEAFQGLLRKHGVHSLGTDTEAWRAATEKNRTVEQFARDGIPQMETINLGQPSPEQAASAFGRLGRDVWARPAIGMGGHDVFHITTQEQLHKAIRHYAQSEQNWLITRDAGNFDRDGHRHQFRVIVLDGHALYACEHVQADPEAPCNESQGAVATVLPIDDLPAGLAQLAVAATKSLGLPFAGVDLAAESGGVVFEVNVHPTIVSHRSLATIAIPYVTAHLTTPNPTLAASL